MQRNTRSTGHSALREIRESGAGLDRVHLSIDGLPLAMLDGSNIYYLHPDRLGTTQRITDAGQRIVLVRPLRAVRQARAGRFSVPA